MNYYSIRSKVHFVLFGLCLVFNLQNCGGAQNSGGEPSSTENPTSTTSSSADTTSHDTNRTLSYSLNIQIESDDTNLNLDLNNNYQLDLLIKNTGTVVLHASDFPKMVYRTCSLESTRSDCDTYTDAVGTLDLDIVIDACGRLIADENCGANDTTLFSGRIEKTGSMTLNNISIRMRAFAVSDQLDGFTSKDSDEGLLVMNRLLVSLTTGTVESDAFLESGSSINDNLVTLVSVGTLSSTIPTLGGAEYASTMTAEFDQDPLSLLP